MRARHETRLIIINTIFFYLHINFLSSSWRTFWLSFCVYKSWAIVGVNWANGRERRLVLIDELIEGGRDLVVVGNSVLFQHDRGQT